ncbi:formate/nitrite transporter family protein [Calderihabitans maritimus]|uniref:Formate/nitrite transporter n=1 Tax=Calderihabitans maritimus TaxID=1246530 RepID=A0A1Z5HXQ4_9FIRM|nr:formate/nitrite family transporter [Calderihabitans maritimus]GAW94198.1 formate/nitrite transporter [Calderihabitans maritimus]
MEERLNIDLLSPEAVTAKAESLGVKKAKNTLRSTVMLGILAGTFIALAGEFYIIATFDARVGPSLAKLLGGLAFSLGLILVVIAGAELFTGNTLLIIAYMTRKISLGLLLRNWILVYFGNLLGSLFIVFLVYYSEQWRLGNLAFGITGMQIALAKVSNDFTTNLLRGILANMLVVLAIWLSYSGRSVTDKVLAIIFPITAFVASGFEHSIANMFFIPFGLVLKENEAVRQAFMAQTGISSLDNLTLESFLVNNLIPVTLGNIIGGGFLVGLVYWFVYLHKRV